MKAFNRLVLVLVFAAAARSAHAEDILFFGNSFTSVNDIPKMVEAIAVSKGKTAATVAVTKGGQGWSYHLGQPATDAALKRKAWNWVVLQDQSLNATHARIDKGDDFLKTGQQFYQRIADNAPTANILLYETWAYAPKHAVFAAKNGKTATFASPAAMVAEIQKNYAAVQAELRKHDAKRQVLLAPVGTAFANCVRQHPEVKLFAADHKHQNVAGSYLSALVIYATVFKDSPIGAAPGKVDAQQAKILQQVADETVKAAHERK